MNYNNKGVNRSRWEILHDVLETCNGNGGVSLTTIIRKANLNSSQAAYCIEILSKSNLLRVIDQSIKNPRQNNNKRTHPCYVITSEGRTYIDLFDKLQKMVEL